jgi:hypothetical protein
MIIPAQLVKDLLLSCLILNVQYLTSFILPLNPLAVVLDSRYKDAWLIQKGGHRKNLEICGHSPGGFRNAALKQLFVAPTICDFRKLLNIKTSGFAKSVKILTYFLEVTEKFTLHVNPQMKRDI